MVDPCKKKNNVYEARLERRSSYRRLRGGYHIFGWDRSASSSFLLLPSPLVGLEDKDAGSAAGAVEAPEYHAFQEGERSRVVYR